MILMTLDTEKAFDSVNQLFLFTAIEKYGFNEGFYQMDTYSNTKLRILCY